MAVCFELTDGVYQPSSTSTSECVGYVMVESEDLQSQLDSTDVLTLFAAACTYYATAFVFRGVLRQLGFF